MSSHNDKLIAVVGATGQQGGAVVRALQAGSQFKVRALSRNPDKHRDLASEAVKADLNRPETLKAAFEGANGVFLVTNFWEQGTDELKQATAAVRAAKDAGVEHLIWSTLPDVQNKVPTSSSRQPRPYALPRMPVSNTLSGPRCPMYRRLAAASSTLPTLPARPRSIG